MHGSARASVAHTTERRRIPQLLQSGTSNGAGPDSSTCDTPTARQSPRPSATDSFSGVGSSPLHRPFEIERRAIPTIQGRSFVSEMIRTRNRRPVRARSSPLQGRADYGRSCGAHQSELERDRLGSRRNRRAATHASARPVRYVTRCHRGRCSRSCAKDEAGATEVRGLEASRLSAICGRLPRRQLCKARPSPEVTHPINDPGVLGCAAAE